MNTHLLSFHLSLLLALSSSRAHGSEVGAPPKTAKVPAVFVFGDSTSDPGNNNYILTAFRGNFPPYGQDFPNKVPTGRFSNGRLTSDFVAEYMGVKKYIPPYLDPTLSMRELTTGVSFASAGSGFDPLTTEISGVLSMRAQLRHFREYKRRVEAAIGREKAEDLIRKSVYLVSAGTNDYVVNYYTLPFRRGRYSVSDYQLFILGFLDRFIKGLWEEGARNIAVAGLPPMGCLPVVITMHSADILHDRGCFEPMSRVARNYNRLLQKRLNSILASIPDHNTKITYVDIDTPVSRMIRDPAEFGFEEVNIGCCGTGYIEASFLCNPGSYVCPNASKYVFWDSIHPSEATYHLVANLLRPAIDSMIANAPNYSRPIDQCCM